LASGTYDSDGVAGNWAGGNDAYLGLRFDINGNVHYGWARVIVNPDNVYDAGEIPTIAYNTVPDQPVFAGQFDRVAPEPGTLGLLALGSAGLAFWRRRKQVKGAGNQA
jgi:hypothetical protein